MISYAIKQTKYKHINVQKKIYKTSQYNKMKDFLFLFFFWPNTKGCCL